MKFTAPAALAVALLAQCGLTAPELTQCITYRASSHDLLDRGIIGACRSVGHGYGWACDTMKSYLVFDGPTNHTLTYASKGADSWTLIKCTDGSNWVAGCTAGHHFKTEFPAECEAIYDVLSIGPY
ncbi:hypothetical protein E4U42_002315 [Claviceps africana]|uniref:Cyanovirin-N domain-containing protein n=1 Tax=Claviceps africana TaxID=83212 RepID=A0A8K0JED7_9HYPO|nr:hypothetical protein E4U42_002315 [Claviceps africana]